MKYNTIQSVPFRSHEVIKPQTHNYIHIPCSCVLKVYLNSILLIFDVKVSQGSKVSLQMSVVTCNKWSHDDIMCDHKDPKGAWPHLKATSSPMHTYRYIGNLHSHQCYKIMKSLGWCTVNWVSCDSRHYPLPPANSEFWEPSWSTREDGRNRFA